MEKLSNKTKADLRSRYYFEIEGVMESLGVNYERCNGGILIQDPGTGVWLVVNVTVKDENKFDLLNERRNYAEKQAAKAARDEAAAVRAMAKAEKSASTAEQAKQNVEGENYD